MTRPIRGRGVSCLFADVSPKTRTLITMPSRSGRIRAKFGDIPNQGKRERESFQVAINCYELLLHDPWNGPSKLDNGQVSWSSVLKVFRNDIGTKSSDCFINCSSCEAVIIGNSFTVMALCRLNEKVSISCSSDIHLTLDLVVIWVISAQVKFIIGNSKEGAIRFLFEVLLQIVFTETIRTFYFKKSPSIL